jgi:hypothetical protein
MTTQAKATQHGVINRGSEMTRTETFVDAAFAFAVTLLVVSVSQVPGSVAELREAFKAVPAFAASFAIIAMFWYLHHRWSRRFGLDDGLTVLLSLTLVFIVLVYVYPLRMLAASALHWMSGNWLPAGFAITGPADLVGLYVGYGIGFALLASVLWCLYFHGWRQREVVGLNAEERIATRVDLLAIGMIAASGVASASIALMLPADASPWMLALPGLVYNVLVLLPWLTHVYARRLQQHPEYAQPMPTPADPSP